MSKPICSISKLYVGMCEGRMCVDRYRAVEVEEYLESQLAAVTKERDQLRSVVRSTLEYAEIFNNPNCVAIANTLRKYAKQPE